MEQQGLATGEGWGGTAQPTNPARTGRRRFWQKEQECCCGSMAGGGGGRRKRFLQGLWYGLKTSPPPPTHTDPLPKASCTKESAQMGSVSSQSGRKVAVEQFPLVNNSLLFAAGIHSFHLSSPAFKVPFTISCLGGLGWGGVGLPPFLSFPFSFPHSAHSLNTYTQIISLPANHPCHSESKSKLKGKLLEGAAVSHQQLS